MFLTVAGGIIFEDSKKCRRCALTTLYSGRENGYRAKES